MEKWTANSELFFSNEHALTNSKGDGVSSGEFYLKHDVVKLIHELEKREMEALHQLDESQSIIRELADTCEDFPHPDWPVEKVLLSRIDKFLMVNWGKPLYEENDDE